MQGTGTATVEIDVASVQPFIDATRAAIDESSDRTVVIDCSGITFMDSSAFHALVGLTEHAARRGQTLVVGSAQPQCARVLDFCDTDHELTIERLPD